MLRFFFLENHSGCNVENDLERGQRDTGRQVRGCRQHVLVEGIERIR